MNKAEFLIELDNAIKAEMTPEEIYNKFIKPTVKESQKKDVILALIKESAKNYKKSLDFILELCGNEEHK